MTGRSRARRESQAAATQAERTRVELQQQTALAKQRADREQLRMQRLLMRSLRATGGGFFETDRSSRLGGSGVLG